MTMEEARKAVVEKLENLGLIEKIETSHKTASASLTGPKP